MADFVWGLRERAATTSRCWRSDAPHLGERRGWSAPAEKAVDRPTATQRQLRGYSLATVAGPPAAPDHCGSGQCLRRIRLLARDYQHWDVNPPRPLDQLGPELLAAASGGRPCVVQHHVGFVHAPFPPSASAKQRSLLGQKQRQRAVRPALLERRASRLNSERRLPRAARRALRRRSGAHARATGLRDGSRQRPAESLLRRAADGQQRSTHLDRGLDPAGAAGAERVSPARRRQLPEADTASELEQWLKQHNPRWDGAVCRAAWTAWHWHRSYALHHVGVFPLHPPGGIRNCGRGNDGLRTVVVSSGVGGAGELIDDGRTGLSFRNSDSKDLAWCLKRLACDYNLFKSLSQAGRAKVQQHFSVMASAKALEAGFRQDTANYEKCYFK